MSRTKETRLATTKNQVLARVHLARTWFLVNGRSCSLLCRQSVERHPGREGAQAGCGPVQGLPDQHARVGFIEQVHELSWRDPARGHRVHQPAERLRLPS